MNDAVSTIRSNNGPLIATAVSAPDPARQAMVRVTGNFDVPAFESTDQFDFTTSRGRTILAEISDVTSDSITLPYAGVWHVHVIAIVDTSGTDTTGTIRITPRITSDDSTDAQPHGGHKSDSVFDSSFDVSMEMTAANDGALLGCLLENLGSRRIQGNLMLGAHYIGGSGT